VLTEELVMGKSSARWQNWLRRLVIPGTGPDDPQVDELKSVAAADVAELEEEERHFDPDGPGRDPDEL
jgi:hypothetical protein